MNKPHTHSASSSPLFRALGEQASQLVVEIDGEQVAAAAGDTVASLLLRHIAPQFYRHSAIAGTPRAPLCLMGVCFECLVEIDGQANQQGCLVRVRNGMRIRRQNREGGVNEQA